MDCAPAALLASVASAWPRWLPAKDKRSEGACSAGRALPARGSVALLLLRLLAHYSWRLRDCGWEPLKGKQRRESEVELDLQKSGYGPRCCPWEGMASCHTRWAAQDTPAARRRVSVLAWPQGRLVVGDRGDRWACLGRAPIDRPGSKFQTFFRGQSSG